MNLLLDTNILIHLIKDPSLRLLTNIINPDEKRLIVCIASIGELKSIALQNNWGEKKIQAMDLVLEKVSIVEINENLAGTYAEIDAYLQHRNPSFKDYPFKTPRNMGKNDLWIASTAALLGLKLVTTDADFNHLHQIFIEVQTVKADLFKG
jgi:tRNA(fMet)-specific endonuclease VapC